MNQNAHAHHMLLTTQRSDLSPPDFISQAAHIFAVFDQRTQDSGNVSYGVTAGERKYFVKTAGSESTAGSLPFEDRVALLHNAIRLNRSVTHHTLPALRNVVESAGGPILVYDWAEGELLGVPREQRSNA
ncbi:MAG: hypothetical protein ACREMA_02705, partial [Longimicrobiales bacterium]